jgi:hypothetical protein
MDSIIPLLSLKFLTKYFFWKKTTNKIRKNAVKVIKPWFAPKPKPIAIAKKRKVNSSGSLIAPRYLTIDRAPTRPKDSEKMT